ASGCPVIVSKTAGASEVLTDGENALLVPPKNPDLYEQLSRKGRLFVEQNISWRKYTEYMLKVFEEVIKRNKGIPRY
ncbi:MAG: hypothetical protein U1A25_01235, partial [Candidatus Sungbacteria bacterium]|nr:hypothetical protein [Candidatus Sungbacteria bacterium]